MSDEIITGKNQSYRARVHIVAWGWWEIVIEKLYFDLFAGFVWQTTKRYSVDTHEQAITFAAWELDETEPRP